MTVVFIVFLGLLLLAAAYMVMLFNQLVQVKHGVDKAWANIDVLLKQRHDEIPKLVEVCKQYKQFEAGMMQQVMDARANVYNARSSQDIGSLNAAESSLRTGISRLFAIGEAYPELKANNSYVQLQNRISGLESDIADRRELYNEAVNINNIRIEQFPASVVASMFHFGERDLLEFSTEEKTDHNLRDLFAA